MAKTRVPKVYEIIAARRYWTDAPLWKTDEEKKHVVLTTDPDELEKIFEAMLYSKGYIKIPRSMILSKDYQALPRAARSVFIWLLVKRKVIEKKAADGVRDEETDLLPAVTSSRKEVAYYTGIDEKNITKIMNTLRRADVLEDDHNKGNTAKSYKLKEWPEDYQGWFPLSIKTVICPAWRKLGHAARQLYLIMLSEHAAAKGETGLRFPRYDIPYSLIRDMYGMNVKTISNALNELDEMSFVYIDRGEWNTGSRKNSPNYYKISPEHLWMADWIAETTAAILKQDRKTKHLSAGKVVRLKPVLKEEDPVEEIDNDDAAWDALEEVAF